MNGNNKGFIVASNNDSNIPSKNDPIYNNSSKNSNDVNSSQESPLYQLVEKQTSLIENLIKNMQEAKTKNKPNSETNQDNLNIDDSKIDTNLSTNINQNPESSTEKKNNMNVIENDNKKQKLNPNMMNSNQNSFLTKMILKTPNLLVKIKSK